MSFMIAFIPLSIPVSWVIDTYGFRLAVGIGAVMMGIFGIMRGMAGTNYTLVLWSTFGIAAAQPFLLNTWTKVPANWFALEERATAVGMVTLASLVGTALGMVLTPILMESLSISTIQLYYGGIAAVSAILFIALSRETPPTPPCPPGQEVRALMLDGLKHALTVKVFWFGLAITFVGLGIFNGVTTWVENIIRPRGFTPTDAGTLGALMIVGGVIGAVVIPALSDKYHKRQLFLFVSFIGAIPGLIGLTFATINDHALHLCFRAGIFPHKRHACPHAIHRRSDTSHSRRHIQWTRPTLWAGFCGFCFLNGSTEEFRRFVHTFVIICSWIADPQPILHLANERPAGIGQKYIAPRQSSPSQ